MRRSALVALLAVALVAVLPAATVPAQTAPSAPSAERVSGATRYGTAAAVSARIAEPGVEVVLVATGERFADALASGPAAAAAGAPILLVGRGFLPEESREELVRLSPRRVVVLGGGDAITDDVVAALRATVDAPVERRFGDGRIDTAAIVSEEAFAPGASVAYIASGNTFPDALAGGAAGGVTGGPVLLTTRDSLPEATARELRRLQPDRIVVLGGAAAVSGQVEAALRGLAEDVVRLRGDDRYGTAVAVSAEVFPDGTDVAYLATGFAFSDALAGAPAAARDAGPVLLVPRDCVPALVGEELDRLGVERVVLLGGTEALAPPVAELEPCEPEEPVDDPEEPVDVVVSTVVAGLTQPWSVAVTPGGRMFVSERDSGRIVRVEGDGSTTEVARLEVNNAGEGGLLGLAVRSDWPDDGFLYAYRTTTTDNEVVRVDGAGQVHDVVVDDIPRASIHDGGRIRFGPDGMLYVATGDAAEPGRAQDPDSLAGKILRVTPEGDAPDDNPTAGSLVYSLGHRNVQGLTWDAAGRLYASELGPACDDEINRIEPGGNYGWPDDCGQDDGIPPVISKQPAEASWSGASFLVDGAIPQWEGDLFVAALRGQRLWRFTFDADGRPTGGEEALLPGEHGRLRDVVVGPDGALYVLTGNGAGDLLLRLGPAAG
jgi:glucose/arabinose dehydrogenase/putative cell wall-binding protein